MFTNSFKNDFFCHNEKDNFLVIVIIEDASVKRSTVPLI